MQILVHDLGFGVGVDSGLTTGLAAARVRTARTGMMNFILIAL
jgi:hypothetical protein